VAAGGVAPGALPRTSPARQTGWRRQPRRRQNQITAGGDRGAAEVVVLDHLLEAGDAGGDRHGGPQGRGQRGRCRLAGRHRPAPSRRQPPRRDIGEGSQVSAVLLQQGVVFLAVALTPARRVKAQERPQKEVGSRGRRLEPGEAALGNTMQVLSWTVVRCAGGGQAVGTAPVLRLKRLDETAFSRRASTA
jgi:hypothetical protein